MKRGAAELLPFVLSCVVALTQKPSLIKNRNGIFRIVGIPGTGTQSLPESYVQGFSRWKATAVTSSAPPTLTRRNKNEDCIMQLRQLGRHGASAVFMRPSIDFVIRGGVPSYVIAGLEVSAQVDTVDSCSSSTSCDIIGQQWMAFAMAVEPNMRLAVFSGAADGTDDRLVMVDNNQFKASLERLGVALSESSPLTDDLAQGFHIVSMPVMDDWIKLTRTVGSNDASAETTISCIATAESDIRELFTLDQGLLEMTASSVLQVKIPA